MRLAKCNGERCGATFPPHARFCPRCGKAVDVVVPPPARPRASGCRTGARFPILRVILLCWLVVFVLKSLRHGVNSPPAPATPVIVSPPPLPEESGEPVAIPDVTSFDAFVAWKADHPRAGRSREQIEGREIRWSGVLKKSIIPGRYELAQDEAQGKGTIHLLPVTSDVRQDLRRLKSGAHVEIEGVLMDERALHLVTVREVQ